MTDHVQIVTTTATKEDAQRIAQTLVEARLTACVQIVGPITSTYRWRGEIETAQEWQCVAKTRGDLYARVEETIRRTHSYEVPEIVALPIVAESPDYARWLDEQTRGDG
jgi:periplasmic divalent cation tolerance protein